MDRRTAAYLLLAVAAALFGMTFVAVKDVLSLMPPLSFVGWRFLIGATVLLVIGRPTGRAVWRDGALAGVVLFAGFATQTIGLDSTSASNSGLITGLYVVFTPVLAAFFRRSQPALSTVLGATVSVVGLGFLTLTNGFSLSAGDVWTLLCAFAFAVHIVMLASLAPRHEVAAFTAVQLAVTAILSLGLSAIIESAGLPPAEAWLTLLGTGVVVTCGAFLIQVWAQTVIGPSRTAIMLALEPVFAVATASAVLGERLSPRGWAGAALIMGGIYIVLVWAPPEDTDIRTAEALSEAH